MRRLIALLVLAGLLPACSSSGHTAAAPVPTTTARVATTTTTSPPRCPAKSQTTLARIDVKVAGKPHYALVHIPARWSGKTAVPLILSFHGLGAGAVSQRATDGFVARSDKDGFIVVYPQAAGTGKFGAAWDLKGTSDVAFVTALLDDLERRECVDPSRVYATGLSYGGAMTDLLACSLADRLAAVASVSAYLPKRPCAPARPVPIISFHGVEDHLLPYAGSARSAQQPFEGWGADWAKRDGCTGRPVEKQYKATVEQLAYAGCRAPVVLYRVHHNGHVWPGHPFGLDRRVLVNYFSGKATGKPYPLMVALGLTPAEFADTISLANTDIDASAMILAFFRRYTLAPPS